jgi:hypothetical protein
VPRDLEQIVMKALRRRPSDRWQSAGDLAQALSDFLRGYAPQFTARQLGVFIEEVAGQKALRRRGLDEPTTALPKPPPWPHIREATGGTPWEAGQERPRDPSSLLFRTPPPGHELTHSLDEDDLQDATRVEETPAALLEAEGAGPMARLDEDLIGTEPTALAQPPRPPPVRPPPTAAPPAPVPAPPRPAPPAPAVPESVPPPAAQPGGTRDLLLAFVLALLLGAGGMAAIVLWPSAPRRGLLEISSAPPGAVVAIDGREVPTPTPVRIVDLDTRAPHRITVRMPGYQPWETEVRFEEQEQMRAVQAVLTREK